MACLCLGTSSQSPLFEGNNEESILNEVCQCTSVSDDKVEKSESQSSVTFKIPQVALNSEDGERATVEEDGQCLKANDQCLSYDAQAVVEEPPRTSCDVVSMEHQPNINSRRQSTRNRPLSLRALESLETFIQTN